jgi:hypothetical protein
MVMDKQIANIFTKLLSEEKFCALRLELGMGNPPWTQSL